MTSEQLGLSDFGEQFGVAASSLPTACRDAIGSGDFRYSRPVGAARDAIVLHVLKHIESDKPTRVGEHRAAIWEGCWSRALEKFVDAGHDPGALVPEFFVGGRPIRLRQDYAIAPNPRFELDFLQVCRAFLFDRFLASPRSVYEFGCGSGVNLVALAAQLPGKKLYGLDWSSSAVATVDLLRTKLGVDIAGRRFDFFDPDGSLEFDRGAAVITVCALEQVGARHDRFVQFLLERRPAVCVHLEPLAELYDPANLVDFLALGYHRKRGYLEGFLPAMRVLEAAGRLEILEVKRFGFGSLYHEAYSYIAWRPC